MYLNDTTVMYVEDDLATQKLIEKILNIVLSDIVMPNMNGIEMSEKIRELNPKQIISLFTAYNEPEFKEKASELNIDAYIMKPLDEKQFFTSLNYLAMAFHTDIEIKKEI
jgi:two-component system response regulator YesN